MLIIDSHIHMFDIYGGFDISKPLKKIPIGFLSVLEWFNFHRPGAKDRKSARLIGDLVFAESCKRIQLCNPDIYLNYFDKNRISYGILMPVAPNVSTEPILEVCSKYSRMIPFASVDFNDKASVGKLEGYMSRGCRGLKIHPVLQRIHPLSDKVYNVLEEYKKHNLPVAIHVGPCRAAMIETVVETYASPFAIKTLACDFKDIPFIFAHMGLQYYDEVIRIAKKYENIYLDTSFQPPAVLKKAGKTIGTKRIVFGSDFPLVDQKSVIKVICKAFHATGQREEIFYENISNLIRFVP